MTEGRKRVLIVVGALIWVGPLNPFRLLPIFHRFLSCLYQGLLLLRRFLHQIEFRARDIVLFHTS